MTPTIRTHVETRVNRSRAEQSQRPHKQGCIHEVGVVVVETIEQTAEALTNRHTVLAFVAQTYRALQQQLLAFVHLNVVPLENNPRNCSNETATRHIAVRVALRLNGRDENFVADREVHSRGKGGKLVSTTTPHRKTKDSHLQACVVVLRHGVHRLRIAHSRGKRFHKHVERDDHVLVDEGLVVRQSRAVLRDYTRPSIVHPLNELRLGEGS